MNDFTSEPDSAQPTTLNNTPQTYEEWKRLHGYQSDTERFLEIGQRVKACYDLNNEDECDVDDSWNIWQGLHGGDVEPDMPKPEYVDEGTLGTVEKFHPTERHTYEVRFDNGVVFWCAWWDEYDDEDTWEITPVGKSPSELAYEQSERERLAAFKQMSLFEAVSE